MKTFRAVLLLSCLTAAAALSAPMATGATVYKWIDENGVVNYTTTPPAPSRAAKVATVEVAPPAEVRGAAQDNGEAQYWRARAEREAARDLAEQRLRRETEELRQVKLRQDIVAADTEARKKSAAQVAYEQCRAERRVDCDSNAAVAVGGVLATSVVYPQVVVIARPTRSVAVQKPYFSSPPNFTPGFSGMMAPAR